MGNLSRRKNLLLRAGVAARSDRVARPLKTSTDGACTSSPGNLCCCFTLLRVKKVFLISTLNPPRFNFWLLSLGCSPHIAASSSHLPPHCDLEGCCKLPPSCLCPPAEPAPLLQPLRPGQLLQPPPPRWPSGLRLFPVLEGPKLAGV